MPYAILDPIVRSYVEEYVSTFGGFCSWFEQLQSVVSSDVDLVSSWVTSNTAEADYNRIVSLIGRMEYKRRQTCPGTKVSKVAFGIGRRIPIVEKWS